MAQEMDGRVCLVTGANAGIGYETALGLAHLGATMVLVARDRGKGEEAKRRIEQTTGNASVDLLIADLAVMTRCGASRRRSRSATTGCTCW